MSILNKVINGAKGAMNSGGRSTNTRSPGTGGTRGTTSGGGGGLAGKAKKFLKR